MLYQYITMIYLIIDILLMDHVRQLMIVYTRLKSTLSRIFDASHPAGSDISDLIECRYISYYDYIQSGYKKEDKDVGQYIDMTEYWGIEGAKMLKDELTKINNRNTKLIAPTLVLKFKKEPENKGKFQFNLVFHFGRKKK